MASGSFEKTLSHSIAFWIWRVCDVIYISDKSGSESSVLRLHRIVTIGNERSNAHSYEGLLLFVLPWPPEGQNWPSKCENTRILLVVSFFEVPLILKQRAIFPYKQTIHTGELWSKSPLKNSMHALPQVAKPSLSKMPCSRPLLFKKGEMS